MYRYHLHVSKAQECTFWLILELWQRLGGQGIHLQWLPDTICRAGSGYGVPSQKWQAKLGLGCEPSTQPLVFWTWTHHHEWLPHLCAMTGHFRWWWPLCTGLPRALCARPKAVALILSSCTSWELLVTINITTLLLQSTVNHQELQSWSFLSVFSFRHYNQCCWTVYILVIHSGAGAKLFQHWEKDRSLVCVECNSATCDVAVHSTGAARQHLRSRWTNGAPLETPPGRPRNRDIQWPIAILNDFAVQSSSTLKGPRNWGKQDTARGCTMLLPNLIGTGECQCLAIAGSWATMEVGNMLWDVRIIRLVF